MVTVKTKVMLSRTGIGFVIVGVILGTLGNLGVADFTEIIGLSSTIVGAVLKIIRELMK